MCANGTVHSLASDFGIAAACRLAVEECGKESRMATSREPPNSQNFCDPFVRTI
jgi:hypothetical protein